MLQVPKWRRFVRFWRSDVAADVDEELRFHFDARIADLVAQGLSPEAAAARAVTEFGDVDAVRADLVETGQRLDARRDRRAWFDALRQDLVYALRALRRSPAVSLTIILTLALGVGANTAMFSLLDVIYLRAPAGVGDADAVRRVWSERTFSSGTQFWSGFDYAGYVASAQAVAGRAVVTLYQGPGKRQLARGENAPTVNAAGAAASYFAVLGLQPQLGRFYLPDEDRLTTAAAVAVISEHFWRRAYGGKRDVLGQELSLDGRPFTIIGVAPPGFRGIDLDATDVWVPIGAYVRGTGPRGPPWWQNPNVNGFRVVLRLAPGVRDAELVPRLTQALRGPGIGYKRDTLTVAALGAINAERGPGKVSTEMQVATRLAGVALIILLTACVNVVNLLLARVVHRRREIAVRLALGISRRRLVRLLVTESGLLSVGAGAAALAAAWYGSAILRTLLMPEVEWHGAPLHWRVLLFALAAALVAGTVAGLVPALQAVSPDLTATLKAGARSGVVQRARLRACLVAAQAALSVVLLVGAVLFVRSLHHVKAHDVGYAVDRLVFATATYDTRDSLRDAAFPGRLRALEERLAAIPGVERVALTSMRPMWGMSFAPYFIEGDTAGRKLPDGVFTAVSPDFFAAAGTQVLRGRPWSDARGAETSVAVLVNEAMAQALWPGQDPLGRCVRFKEPTAPCTTVIGVVQNAIVTSIGEEPQAQFYVSLDHPPMKTWGAREVIVRADPRHVPQVQAALRQLLRAEFPGAIPSIHTMAEAMAPEYRPWELGARLFTLFGVLALLVAAVGTYSSVSYAVSQRTHEFGVRLAIGARPADVLRQVAGEGLRIALVGAAAGIALALAAGRAVAALLHGIGPRDPATLAIVAAVLLVIIVTASLVPAWRAARTDPLAALRAD